MGYLAEEKHMKNQRIDIKKKEKKNQNIHNPPPRLGISG